MSEKDNHQKSEDQVLRFRRLLRSAAEEDESSVEQFNMSGLHSGYAHSESAPSVEISEEPDKSLEGRNPGNDFDDDDTRPLPSNFPGPDDEPTVLTIGANHLSRSADYPAPFYGSNQTGTQPKRKEEIPTRPLTAISVADDRNPVPAPNKRSVSDGQRSKSKKDKRGNKRKKSTLGCLLRSGFIVLFVILTILLCATTFLFYQYYRIASELPDIQDLRQNASQFETTRILDRNGNVLYEILDPNAGRRTYVPLEQISPYLIAATVATEDKGFYSHPGFDAMAIVRAFYQNYQSGETVSGASTITQQLARTLLFTPEERYDISYARKIREAVLAAEITRRYTKDEILELYLNENYYGNLAYGVQAAAETYFGTTANQLTLGEAAFLAGLPQAPSVYDVYTNPDIVFDRFEDVLVLMYQASQEQGCIFVSNSPQRVCLSPVEITEAADEIKNAEFKSPDIKIRYPHWVFYVRSLLEAQYDAQTIYRSGFSVYTTLDPSLQDLAEDVVSDQVLALASNKATGGSLVAIRPSTGEILAMVGSPDFFNEENSGQVNMAISPRQPGSAMKPLTYLAAFEKGWTPATLLWDVPSEFTPSGRPDDPGPPYKPVNYDDRFHGPVTVRSALANSYNIPAVKALEFVGIYDNPDTPIDDGLISIARRMGITTLIRDDYGLSLTLGGGDVTLLQLTGAYAAIANSGRRIPPVAITKILDHEGNVVFDYQQPPGEQVIRPEHAYLISDIMSDNKARSPAFGGDSVLRLPFQVAVKTGTTNDFRDNWTIGYTPDLSVGVWFGNADYTPMQNTSGLTGAAPAWSNYMKDAVRLITGDNPSTFIKPPGIIEKTICALSGAEPSEWCPDLRSELFAADQPPLPREEDLWSEIIMDTWTGLRASVACSEYVDEQFVLNVTDRDARRWIRQDPQGQEWAKNIGFKKPVQFVPSRECRNDDPQVRLFFVSPRDDDTIKTSPLEIYVQASATSWFESVQLDYGIGLDPDKWEKLTQISRPLEQSDLIYQWNLDEIPSGFVTLRLYMRSTEGTYAEKRMLLNIQVPTPTPTLTPTPTYTPTPTLTFTPTQTPTITSTPTPTSSPVPSSPTPVPPTNTPQASATPAPNP